MPGRLARQAGQRVGAVGPALAQLGFERVGAFGQRGRIGADDDQRVRQHHLARRRSGARPARCRPACGRSPPGSSARRRTSPAPAAAWRSRPAGRRPRPARRTAPRRSRACRPASRRRRARPGSGSRSPAPAAPARRRSGAPAARRHAEPATSAQPGSVVVRRGTTQPGVPCHRCATRTLAVRRLRPSNRPRRRCRRPAAARARRRNRRGAGSPRDDACARGPSISAPGACAAAR